MNAIRMPVSPCEDIVLTLVIPVHNEESAISALAEEISSALSASGLAWEACWVDDGSCDATRDRLRQLPSPHRFLAFACRQGKSAAYAAGFQDARGDWVVTLDGDGQDDPAEVPFLLEHAQIHGADLVIGVREGRRDSLVRRASSWIGNRVRIFFTGDLFRDIGCGLRAGRRAAFLELPRFEGMHRFLPTFVASRGWRVLERPVRHRPRQTGRSKYGVLNRLACGMMDLVGVRWLLRRHRQWVVVEHSPKPHEAPGCSPSALPPI